MRRENLDQRLLILFRRLVSVEHPVVILVLLVALLGLFGPFMLLGGVVEHQINADAHALGAQGCRHLLKVGHRAERGIDRPVILDRIAAVAVARTRLEAGHEMDIVGPDRLQMIEMVEHLDQLAGKPVDVEHIADHLLGQEPIRIEIALQVEVLEVGRPLGPAALEQGFEIGAEGLVAGQGAVEPVERVGQVGEAARRGGDRTGGASWGESGGVLLESAFDCDLPAMRCVSRRALKFWNVVIGFPNRFQMQGVGWKFVALALPSSFEARCARTSG